MININKGIRDKFFLLIIFLLFCPFTQFVLADNTDYVIEATFGEYGIRAGEFNYPVDITLDQDDNLYISDWENDRIQVFDNNGTFLRMIPDETGKVQLDGPVGIALDGENNIYIVEQHNHRIQKISSDGQSTVVFGQIGNKPGEFDNPRGIALDHDGNIYVVDTGNNRVQIFSKDFDLLYIFGREGMGDGEFYYPRGIALDHDGNIYVADTFHHQVQIFNEKGQFIRRLGSSGSGPGEFNGTRYIAIDKHNNTYITDYRNGKVVQYDNNYNFVTEFGADEHGISLMYPEGIVIDQRGYIFVADAGNNRIVKYCISKIIINKKLGMEFLENKQWGEAIQSFQKVLEEDPKDIESRKALALAYSENAQSELAIEQFTLILQEYPQDQNIVVKLIDTHYALASQYAKENRYKDALSHYKVVLKNQPNYPELKINYYLTYLKYLINSLSFKIVIAAIVFLILFFIIFPKLSKKNKKGGKHYRGRSRF